MAGAPPNRGVFRQFPGAPPLPRQPRQWSEDSAKKWGTDLLRVLDQQNQPLTTAVYSASSGPYAIKVTTDYTVVIGSAAAPFTTTLPPVDLNVNKVVTVKNRPGSASNITLDGDGANIDGAATQAIVPGDALQVVSDGAAWWIIVLLLVLFGSPAWASYVKPTPQPTPTLVPTATPQPTATLVPTATPVVDAGGSYVPPHYAVASLPTCDAAKAYALAAVSDATACTNGTTPTGGGSTKCLVWCNGTVWVEL